MKYILNSQSDRKEKRLIYIMRSDGLCLNVFQYSQSPQQWGFFVVQEEEICFLPPHPIIWVLNNFTMYTRRALAQKKTKISL